MAGITLAQAETQLAAWLECSVKVATGQTYTIGGRTLTRANAQYILEQIDYWDQKVKAVSTNASGPAISIGIPRR